MSRKAPLLSADSFSYSSSLFSAASTVVFLSTAPSKSNSAKCCSGLLTGLPPPPRYAVTAAQTSPNPL